MLYYKYKTKKEAEHMKNKYIPKKLKFTIILNALYQRSDTFTPYTISETLNHIGKVLMPNCGEIKFSQLHKWYQNISFDIMDITGDWAVRAPHVIEYANTHNIKLYPREYFGL